VAPDFPIPTARAVADSLGLPRERQPLVQGLTNIVVAQWAANVLPATGVAPAMVDDLHEAALDGARRLELQHGTTVAVSGPVDRVTDGHSLACIIRGYPLMTRVTGVGCALGALMAAFCAVLQNSVLAATAATAVLTVAADKAGLTAALEAADKLRVGYGHVHHFHDVWATT